MSYGISTALTRRRHRSKRLSTTSTGKIRKMLVSRGFQIDISTTYFDDHYLFFSEPHSILAPEGPPIDVAELERAIAEKIREDEMARNPEKAASPPVQQQQVAAAPVQQPDIAAQKQEDEYKAQEVPAPAEPVFSPQPHHERNGRLVVKRWRMCGIRQNLDNHSTARSMPKTNTALSISMLLNFDLEFRVVSLNLEI